MTCDLYELRDAICQGNVELVRSLLSSGVEVRDSHLLGTAASMGQIEIMQMLIDAGLDVNQDQTFALRFAVHEDQVDAARLLLQLGANIDVVYEYSLPYAATEEYIDMVRLLLSFSATVPNSLLTEKFIELALILVGEGFWHPCFNYSPLLVDKYTRLNEIITAEVGDDAAFFIFSNVYSQWA